MRGGAARGMRRVKVHVSVQNGLWKGWKDYVFLVERVGGNKLTDHALWYNQNSS